MVLVLLDTNVIISGLFFKGNEQRVLQEFFRKNFTNVMPEHVLIELQRIIERKFKHHHLVPVVHAGIDMIKGLSLFFPCEAYAGNIKDAAGMIRDRKDSFILACALTARPDLLVTGDRDFHAISDPPFRIVTTREFLQLL